MDIFSLIIKYLLLPATIVSIIGYFGKQIFNHYITKKLELYKSELDKSFYEHQIRFSKLHEKRGIIVEEIYHKLIDATGYTMDLFQLVRYGKVDMNKLREDTGEKWKHFIDYFKHNNIYFESNICNHIEDMIQIVLNLFGQEEKNKLLIEEIIANPDMSENERQELNEGKQQIRNLINKIIPENVGLIGNEFRKIIGVSNEQ